MTWSSKIFAKRVCEFNLDKVKDTGFPYKRRPMKDAYGNSFQSADEKVTEREIKDKWIEQCGLSFSDWDDEVRIRIECQRSCGSTVSLYKQGSPDLCIPDIDNIAKGILDALKETAWKDDRQVTDLHITKLPRFRRRKAYLRITITYISNECRR